MEDSDTIRLLPDDSHNDYGTIPEVSSHRVSDKCETERPKSRFRLPSLESACVIISTTLWTIRSATWRDVTLMLLGSLFAILSGASTPILGLFFGDMTNAFMSQSTYGLIPDEVAHARNNDSEITFERNVKMIGHVRHFVEKLSISNDTYPSLTTNGSTVIPMTASQFHSILDQYVIIYFIIGTLMLLSCFLQTICWELASEHMVFNLRKLYLSRILRQDIAWYDQNDNLNLSNKLADDAERIREGTGYKCALFIQYISTFVTGIVVGLVVNYRLTLIIMVLAPILVYLLGDIIRVSSSSMILEQEKYAAAGYVAEEALSNIRTVNAFGGQVVEVKKYNFWLEEVRKDAMKKNKKFAFLVGSMFLVMYGTYALGFAAGSYLIRIGYSSAGSVFAVFLSVISGAMIAGQCFPSLTAISSALGVLASIRNIVERNVVIDPYSEEGRKALKIIGNIEFKNTSFAYPSRPEIRVLDGFNLKIEPGKQIAIVGSSGAGKSTIISLILRYYDPTEGEVYIDDVPVRDYNVRWLRQQIGLVSQEPVLFGASIAENIKYGADDVTHSQVIEAAKKANAHDFILSLPKGYETLVGDTGSQLSGGQKQRIAIARALVRDPKILLLDEATSALDSLSEGIVQDALENVMKGRTTIIVAHRLSTIRNADMICVMQMGKFVESGTHTELMQKKSHYFDLIEAQMSREVTLPTGTENEEALDNDPKKDEVFLTPSICPLEEGNNMTIIESDVMERAMSIRELIEMQLPERRWLLMSLLGTVGCGLVVPLFAIYYGEIFEVFQLTGDALIEASKFWTYTFLVFAIYSSIVYFIQAYYTSISSDELMARARTLVFENILRQPVGWFDLDSSAPGVLVNRLAHNAPIIKAAIGVGCTQFVSCGITISASIVITLVCSWQLALVFGVVVPLAIWLLVRQQRVRNFQIKHDIQLVENAGRIASESVRNVRTVQALGRELFFTEMYARNLEVPYKNAMKRALTYSLVYGLSQGLVLYMYAIAFWFGGYLVEIGAISKENIYRVFFALSQCVTFVGTTFAYVPEFSKARQAVWLLNYLLKRESEIDSSSESGAKPDILGAVEFKDVHFAYPSRPTIEVLKGLSFSVEAGKTLALVGESGCGKSTVISLLERFYDPKSGTILVDGYNICGLNVGHLRSNIGLVSQEPILFNSSIKENIQYGAVELREIVPFEQIKNAAKLANIDDFIMSLPDRYDTLVGERGVQLSGGQKQRVAIARALIRNPKILLLDEATSALDTESEKIVQAALDEAKIGRTCIVVAHRLSTIQNADVICVLDKGKIVERGTHAELQALRGLYFQLTQRQAL